MKKSFRDFDANSVRDALRPRDRDEHLMRGMEPYIPSQLILPTALVRALETQKSAKKAEIDNLNAKAQADAEVRANKSVEENRVQPALFVPRGKEFVQVFGEDSIRNVQKWLEHSSSEHRNRMKSVCSTLSQSGLYRRVKPARAFSEYGLQQLTDQFPNFEKVIRYLAAQIELAKRGKQHLRVSPILLTGSPGVGKTMFCEAVARYFRTTFHVVRFESAQNGADLAGSSSFWSNAHPGEVFRALLNGQYANPVFFLDELDKAAAGTSYGDVRTALYSLFEPTTNGEFIDQSMPMLRLNCRHIIWFGAANDVRLIPPPILSRMKVFEILTPNFEQTKRIAIRIYNSLLTEHRLADKEHPILTNRILDMLSHYSPRRIRIFLEEALGHALLENSKCLESAWFYRQILDAATLNEQAIPTLLH